ncbi:hypothetical protein LCGC14_0732120 [marine sediment metagenome]|uniref:Uncharacterized protein n=1 Tax=marine sediment metagenome TaxID=412755 RepID=A0A0F9SUF6_9ZZZZ
MGFYKPKDLTPEVLYRIKRRTFIADLILIAVIIALGIYAWFNIEHFKTIGADVCKLCMEKTGATCFNAPVF